MNIKYGSPLHINRAAEALILQYPIEFTAESRRSGGKKRFKDIKHTFTYKDLCAIMFREAIDADEVKYYLEDLGLWNEDTHKNFKFKFRGNKVTSAGNVEINVIRKAKLVLTKDINALLEQVEVIRAKRFELGIIVNCIKTNKPLSKKQSTKLKQLT